MKQEKGAGTSPSERSVRSEILRFLDDTFGRRNWAHKSLLAAIRGLGVEEARWTSEGVAHSVWAQINHVIHWKRYILQRMQGKRPRAYQAWPPAGGTEAELRRTTSALVGLHRDLRNAVLRLARDDLQREKGGRYPLVQLLLASAAHESYHIGQIFLTRKLYRRHRRTTRGLPKI